MYLVKNYMQKSISNESLDLTENELLDIVSKKVKSEMPNVINVQDDGTNEITLDRKSVMSSLAMLIGELAMAESLKNGNKQEAVTIQHPLFSSFVKHFKAQMPQTLKDDIALLYNYRINNNKHEIEIVKKTVLIAVCGIFRAANCLDYTLASVLDENMEKIIKKGGKINIVVDKKNDHAFLIVSKQNNSVISKDDTIIDLWQLDPNPVKVGNGNLLENLSDYIIEQLNEHEIFLMKKINQGMKAFLSSEISNDRNISCATISFNKLLQRIILGSKATLRDGQTLGDLLVDYVEMYRNRRDFTRNIPLNNRTFINYHLKSSVVTTNNR